jgi:hypothetical protein
MDTLVAYDDVKIGTLAFLLGSSFHIFRLCKFQELLGWWCGSSVECLLTSAKPQIHPQYCKKKKKILAMRGEDACSPSTQDG